MVSADVVDANKAQIRGKGLKVVLPEGEDTRIIEAAARLVSEDLAVPVLLGIGDDIASAARDGGISLSGVTLREPALDDALTQYAEMMARARERMRLKMAGRLLRKPLYFGGAMLAAGHADALVAGVANPTRRVIEAGLITVGLRPDIAIPSSFFLMVVPGADGAEPQSFVFADCAVNADPSAEDLADIAIASADSAARLLGVVPKVALLSFSTHASANHPHVDKVRAALKCVREKQPDLLVDGELQADTAVSLAVAQNKVSSTSDVAGQANVLVFPDLDAGNIGYKLLQHLGGAQAIGPFLQGFAKPVSDLSRGASVDDIVATVAITLAMA